jgi:amino acid transporter
LINIFSITVAFLRVYAAYLAITSAISAAGLFSLIGKFAPQDPSSKAIVTTNAIQTLLVLIIALLLAFYAKPVARYVTKDLADPDIPLEELGVFQLQATAFSILGMYVLIHAAPGLVKILGAYAFPLHNKQYDVTPTPGGFRPLIPLPDILQLLAQTIIGIWLLIGSRGIASAVRTAWSKGRSK